MKRLASISLAIGMLFASTSAFAGNSVQVSQIGDTGLILVNQADHGSASATITQTGQRNQLQVDQIDTLHNPPSNRNEALIVQGGVNNAINHGLLLPAVRPGQNNTVAGGVINSLSLRQDGSNNAIGYSQAGQGHAINFSQVGHDNAARLTQAGRFDGVEVAESGEFNFLTITQTGNFDRFSGEQTASDSRMTIEQSGNLDFASFHQSGHDNTLLAVQSGPGATAFVTQGGTGNFTQIIH